MESFQAIWDTGATNSVITQAVVDKCMLAPTGITRAYGVQGGHDTETYLVNIYLPNKVVFPAVRVTKGAFPGADVLIGMDIIASGDFSVTNQGGKTIFSYRHPSIKHIDYVKEANAIKVAAAHSGRATPAKRGTNRPQPKKKRGARRR